MNENYTEKTLDSKIPRLELTPLPDVLVKISTQKVYDHLMRIYEAAGWNWKNGHLPTDYMLNAGHGTLIEVLESFNYAESGEIGKGKKEVELEDFYKLENIDEVKKREVFKWFRENKRNRLSLGNRLM